ncbi:Putative beta-barrel porin-2, OmpL-like. bbp2 [Nitrosospira sp. Nsp18]|uniref:porin n=1 Tax=Nitrosospira sp. Nsp18 TaxID=1855334 RepID=UPI000885E603|nr:porin [Nitrosospira sp. Nsp18]SDA27473.1 Putative beta-barrel porin-2, OmpL-like. bbp2 [Nitrosospira sp. Nsp18]
MKCVRRCKGRFLFAISALLSVLMNSSNVHAFKIVDLFKDSGVRVGGWINGGATYNPSNPGNGYNGSVTFADRANRFQLNQFNIYIQRTVVTEGNAFDLGGRFDFMFGTDAIYTQAFGVPSFDVNTGQPRDRGHWDLDLCCSSTRTYGIALPQAYAEAYLPIGNGINIKAGHFYSPTGYETVPSPDNFFYTHAYTFNNGEPFTHTGLMGNYAVNANWSVMAGAITGSATGGWDGGFDKQLGNWGGLGGITWVSNDKRSSINVTGTYSETSARSTRPWGMYNVVLQHRVTPKTHLVLHHVHGYAGGVLLNGAPKNVEWYSLSSHLYYDLLNDLSIGIRGEWFRDRDGFRVFSPFRVLAATDNMGHSSAGNFIPISAPADYYAVTVGMNWKPAKRLKLDWKPMQKLNIRPNIRYDRADGIHQSYRPFNSRKDQVLFSLDATIPF